MASTIQVQYSWHATEVPCVGLFPWHWRDSAYSYNCVTVAGLSVPGSSKLVSTLENTLNWIQREQSRFLCICFFLVSFVDLQMHTVIIFVFMTSVVVYFCSRLPADPTYLDVLKTRVHSILCHLLNLITDYYFGSSSSSVIGTIKWRCWISWWLDAIRLSLYFVWVGNVCSCVFVHIWSRGRTWHWNTEVFLWHQQ